MQREEKKYPYFDLHVRDHSGIAFEHWTDSRSVAMHMHGYYELFLISRGACRHIYDETETLLIPGDAMLVPPHRAHGFSLSGESSIYNCQFLPGSVAETVLEIIQQSVRSDQIPAGQNWNRPEVCKEEEIYIPADREKYYGTDDPAQQSWRANPGKRGVIHLNPREYAFIEPLFRNLLAGDADDQQIYALKKQKITEVILLELDQALRRQNQIYRKYAGKNDLAIADVLTFMEEHLAEPLEFDALSSRYGFSSNHFRKLFRDATGLSPVKYLNRLRVSRACEYMQQGQLTVREAAERVGFADMNYFSRTFKMVMGCSPGRILKTGRLF